MKDPPLRSPDSAEALRDQDLRSTPDVDPTGDEHDGNIAHGEPADGWWSQAACRGLPTDLFFPIGSGETAMRQTALAKLICMRCGVRQECLDYALAIGQPYGIFGGTTEEERRALARRGVPN